MPEMACPFKCIYCNQNIITGQEKTAVENTVEEIIETYLATIPEGCRVEVAFFGGTFTGMPLNVQESYLKKVQKFIDNGSIKSIRLSTRPDYIDKENVTLLKHYRVGTVELGVQSMNDTVLEMVKRGYNSDTVMHAVDLIRRDGIEVGMQMMIGLPGDDEKKAESTAQKIIDAGATNTRIYPTLVVKNTMLEKMYKDGLYTPLSIEKAVEISKRVLLMFEKAGVMVLRVGLHPTQSFIEGTGYVAGPFHVSFRELVETSIWNDILNDKLSCKVKQKSYKDSILTVYTSPKAVNGAVGYNSINKSNLMKMFKEAKFLPDCSLAGREVRMEIKQV